ncbi:hypothetical protein EW026_g8041 [Hermanssonia centrifuga]|uniref:Uncharacterized protein n=1 Tax=Hermanssonia centrifuga TaxID=98765 RepID=A0A4S4K7I4_9APHY|nr:hypothetical protein EW026_g8041 [Hermanssonia centrifuga]
MSELHAFLTRQSDGSIVLRNTVSDARVVFTVEALRAYHRFDALVRQYAVTQDSLIPGGYSEFQTLWNSDRQNRYQFSEYRTLTEDCVIHGAPVPIDILVPRSAQAPSQTNRTNIPGLSADRQETIQELLWESAAASLRKKEWIERKKNERRDKKASRHNIGDRGSPRSHPYGGVSKAAEKKKAGRRTSFDCRSEAGRSDVYIDDRLVGFYDPPIPSSPSSGSGSYSRDPPALTQSAITPNTQASGSPPTFNNIETSSTTVIPAPAATPTSSTPTFVQGSSTQNAAPPTERDIDDDEDFDLDRMFQDYS